MSSSTGSQANSFTYTGEGTDTSTGLEFLRSRYYDPATGSFVSRDVIATPNRFAYAGGDPVNLTDPSGMCVSQDLYNKYKAMLDKLGHSVVEEFQRSAWTQALAGAVNDLCKVEDAASDAASSASNAARSAPDAASKAWGKLPPEAQQCVIWGAGAFTGGNPEVSVIACVAGAAAAKFDPQGRNPFVQCLAWGLGGGLANRRAYGAAVGCITGAASAAAERIAPRNPRAQCLVWEAGSIAAAARGGNRYGLRRAGAAGCGTGAFSVIL